jgi:hypothetical protein
MNLSYYMPELKSTIQMRNKKDALNSKYQISSSKFQINPNDRNSKFQTPSPFGIGGFEFGFWNLFGIWLLVLEIFSVSPSERVRRGFTQG